MFSERLKQLRIEKNMTRTELGRELKMSTATLKAYEEGVRMPSKLKTLIKMAKFFDVSVDYLLGKEGGNQ